VVGDSLQRIYHTTFVFGAISSVYIPAAIYASPTPLLGLFDASSIEERRGMRR
jgi:hypothetical protein